MKDIGLIIINQEDNVDPQRLQNVVQFIDNIEGTDQDTQEVIFGNFPIIFIGNNIPISLEPYISPYLRFSYNNDNNLFEYTNEAGQSVNEVLEILTLRNLYIHDICSTKNEDAIYDNLASRYKVFKLY